MYWEVSQTEWLMVSVCHKTASIETLIDQSLFWQSQSESRDLNEAHTLNIHSRTEAEWCELSNELLHEEHHEHHEQ